MCGYAYRTHGSADFRLVTSSTKEQLEKLQESEEAKISGKFKSKIEAASKKVTKADLAHTEAAEGPAKEGAEQQLDVLRAARDGLVAEREQALEAVAAKFQHMLEVVATHACERACGRNCCAPLLLCLRSSVHCTLHQLCSMDAAGACSDGCQTGGDQGEGTGCPRCVV